MGGFIGGLLGAALGTLAVLCVRSICSMAEQRRVANALEDIADILGELRGRLQKQQDGVD